MRLILKLSILLLLIAPGNVQAFLDDTASHAPPSSGTYEYGNEGSGFCPGTGGYPVAGESYSEPVFNETVTVLTSNYSSARASIGYGDLWTINADNTKFIYGNGSEYCVGDFVNGGLLRCPGLSVTNDTIHWHPTNPDKIIYFSGSNIREYTYSTNTSATIKSYSSTLFSGAQNTICDQSGQYYVALEGGSSGTVRVWDRTEDVVYSNTPSGSNTDHIAMVKDGSGIIVSEAGGYNDVYWYPLNHVTNAVGSGTNLVGYVGHEAYVTDNNGDSWYVGGIERWSGISICGTPTTSLPSFTEDGIYKVKLSSDCDSEGNYELLLAKSAEHHMSGTIIDNSTRRNWVAISWDDSVSGSWDSDPWTPWSAYLGEIMMIDITTGNLKRLAHHRSKDAGSDGYTYQPKASLSSDGQFVIWNSNYGRASAVSGAYVDMYSVTTGLSTETPTPQQSGVSGSFTLN